MLLSLWLPAVLGMVGGQCLFTGCDGFVKRALGGKEGAGANRNGTANSLTSV